MYGYVRPFKPELRMREWTQYRAVYCGLCQTIGQTCGQLPRLAVGYDLTFLAILLGALSEDAPETRLRGCVLNPVRKKRIVKPTPILAYCAALAMILAERHGRDDLRDGQAASGRVQLAVFSRAARKAAERFPEVSQAIDHALEQLRLTELGPPDVDAAAHFGAVLAAGFDGGGTLLRLEPEVRQALLLLGDDLGRWIYLIDAIDDAQSDRDNGRWNPFAGQTDEQARRTASDILSDLEVRLDRTAALLPYRRDGFLIGNIITLGLPDMRLRILAGDKPGRL